MYMGVKEVRYLKKRWRKFQMLSTSFLMISIKKPQGCTFGVYLYHFSSSCTCMRIWEDSSIFLVKLQLGIYLTILYSNNHWFNVNFLPMYSSAFSFKHKEPKLLQGEPQFTKNEHKKFCCKGKWKCHNSWYPCALLEENVAGIYSQEIHEPPHISDSITCLDFTFKLAPFILQFTGECSWWSHLYKQAAISTLQIRQLMSVNGTEVKSDREEEIWYDITYM